MLVGIVTDNEDPEGMGRVKVKFPTLTEDHTSNWARVVSMGAANSRGFDCLPEIDDEVLVAFEHGDIHRPYVLGGVWNGQDAPPNKPEDNVQDGKVRLRTIQTRTGHKLQFVEEDKQEKAGIYLETTGKHKVRLNDSDAFVEIETAAGNVVKLDDKGQSIKIQTTAGQMITIQDPTDIAVTSNGNLSCNAPMSITNTAGAIANTATGAIAWNAGAAASLTTGATFTITSGGNVTITAPLISLIAPVISLTGIVKITGIPIILPPVTP
jgi:uncharacterized protein involved in type VI secretion and phage assembly